MKIAVWHNLPSGGGKRALYYHVRGLVERGHKVESWCPSTADQTYLPLRSLIHERITLLTSRSKVPTHRFGRLHALYAAQIDAIEGLNEHCRQAAEEIGREGFDVLFANTSMGVHASPMGRYVSIPKLLYLQEPNRFLYEALPRLPWIASHTNGGSWWSPKTLRRKIPEWIYLEGLRAQAREELANAQAYDSILVNSFFSRESLIRSYGLSAKVCYLGVDTSLFRPLAKPRERFIVGVGSFRALKGIALAIRSIGLLGEPQLPFVWIANVVDPKYVEEMKSLAASLKVNLRIMESVPDSELVDTLNRAALMLYTPRSEPFGFAPLEANACATPVVAVAEGGVRETVKDNLNGFLVESEPECIAQAVAKILNDPSLARSLGAQALAYVRSEWDLERSVDRLETSLANLSANPPKE